MITNFKIFESAFNSSELIKVIFNFLKKLLMGSKISMIYTDEYIKLKTEVKDYYYIIYITVDRSEDIINFNFCFYQNSDKTVVQREVFTYMKDIYDFLKNVLSKFNYVEHWYSGKKDNDNFHIEYSYYDDIILTIKKLKVQDFQFFVSAKKYNL